MIDADPGACATIRMNARLDGPITDKGVVLEADVSNFDFGPYADGLDLLTAGPPCQPFSRGGKKLGENDGRNMFPALFRAVRELRPRAILVENVWGLMSGKFLEYFGYLLLQVRFPFEDVRAGEDWDAHKSRLAELARQIEAGAVGERFDPAQTYAVWGKALNAADHGLPQIRRRAFIVAFRRDLNVSWSWPASTNSEAALLRALCPDGSYWLQYPHKPFPPLLAVQFKRSLPWLNSQRTWISKVNWTDGRHFETRYAVCQNQ